MPELPEVESIKLQLEKYLVGHKVEKLEVRNSKIFTGDIGDVEGSRVIEIKRYAKVLSISLSNEKSIIIHVKLTGQIIYRGPNLKYPASISKKVVGGAPGPHTHVIFHLDKGGKLFYNDVRRFGWIKVVDTRELASSGFIGRLGPEPFKDLTFKYFEEILTKSSRMIKVVLMDQAKIGGIGNIYANDALWLSKIGPHRSAKSLTVDEKRDLYDAIHKVLKAGLKYGGASELAFVTPDGGEGKYQEHTLVYGRQGTVCGNCKKEKIKKIFLGGRGTYLCARCQK